MLEPGKIALDGLLDRRGFGRRCDEAIAKAGKEPLSLIVCDLDRFERVNAEVGHAEADSTLRRVARAISGSVRPIDEVATIGGDHFGILLPGADELEALEVAERVRAAVRDALADNPVPVTISCGVSTLGSGGNREDLLQAADDALGAAKSLGRDRTVVAAANGDGPEKRVVFAI